MNKALLFLFCIVGSNSYGFFVEKTGFFSPPISTPKLAHHWIVEYKEPPFNSITLEDGSIWLIKPDDFYKLEMWDYSDPVTVKQNRCPISDYQYLIHNPVVNDTIAVHFSFGPIYEGKYTHQIRGVDLNHGYLLLENHSVWKINSSDQYLLTKWYLDDVVVIGTNSSWSSEECILINVNLNEFVRADYL